VTLDRLRYLGAAHAIAAGINPWPRDFYGEYVIGRRPRLRGCRCDVPCLGFRCRSRLHKGSRKSPWCVGSDGESCASCWWARQRGKTVREVQT